MKDCDQDVTNQIPIKAIDRVQRSVYHIFLTLGLIFQLLNLLCIFNVFLILRCFAVYPMVEYIDHTLRETMFNFMPFICPKNSENNSKSH